MSLALTFVINTGFTASQMVCEVPTGVIADTLGRKTSFLLSIGVLLGLGFTFQTGAVDAWMVDALDATGYDGPKESVFALNAEVSGVVLVVGPLVGCAGLLGVLSERTAAGFGPFFAVAALWVGMGFVMGVAGPIAGAAPDGYPVMHG